MFANEFIDAKKKVVEEEEEEERKQIDSNLIAGACKGDNGI